MGFMLKKISIDIEIKKIALEATVEQYFRNTESNCLEAQVCCPIPEFAVINGLEIYRGGKVLRAKVTPDNSCLEKPTGKHHNSFSLKMLDHNILLFTAGCLEPNEEIKIKIFYTSKIHFENNVLRLQIPTTVGPRYLPFSLNNETLATRFFASVNYTDKTSYGVNIRIRMSSGMLSGMKCLSHPISLMRKENEFVIETASGNIEPDRDFLLEITRLSTEKPLLYAEKYDADSSFVYVSLPSKILPDCQTLYSVSNSDNIMVLDCSGSMNGRSIEVAKDGIKQILRSLSKGDSFNIIKFGSKFFPFSNCSVPLTKSNLLMAEKFIDEIEADLGGSELAGALALAASLRGKAQLKRKVFLFSDGEVADGEHLLEYLNGCQKDVRFFCCGIGYGVNSYLFKRLSEQSGGYYVMIHPEELFEEKISRLVHCSKLPGLKNITISCGNEIKDINRNYLLLENTALIFCLKLGKDFENPVIIEGDINGKKYTWQGNFELLDNSNLIKYIWLSEIPDRNSNEDSRQSLCEDLNVLNLNNTLFVEDKENHDSSRPVKRQIQPLIMTKDHWFYLNNEPDTMVFLEDGSGRYGGRKSISYSSPMEVYELKKSS
jgi:Ca-activated chloride channel family protein